MPHPAVTELFGRLLENPESAKDVNWDKVIEISPDINIDNIRKKFGEFLPEAPADADVNFLLAHPLHKPRELTLVNWAGDQLSSGWNWYLEKLTEQGELKFGRTAGLSEAERIVANIGLGGIKAAAGLPAFAADVIRVGRPLASGDVGETVRRGRSLIEEFVAPAAKAAALVTSRLESGGRSPTEIERQFYKDVTGEEAFGVVAPALVAFGGPRMVKAGYKYARGAGRQILSRNFQKIAPLEGLEGEFVRLGDKPKNRKLYHKDPVEGWREFRTKKKAKGELVDALDQYVESVTPRQLPGPVGPPLLVAPEVRGLLPAPEGVFGEGFSVREPRPGESTVNTYLRIPIERVRKDADLGVKAAKEALKIRQFEPVEKPPGRLLEAETPLARPVARRVEPIPRPEISINPEIERIFGRESARKASEFISGILDKGEAGFIRAPTKGELKRGARVVGKVASFGEALARPSVKLRRTEPGRKMIQHVIKAETAERTIRANAEVIMDNAIKKKYPSGKLTRADRTWMKNNFKAFYEDGRSMPNERIQGFANAWETTADRIGRIAEKVGVKIRSKEFRRRKNYFPNILTEKARFALEAKGGRIWDALVAHFEKIAKEKGKKAKEIEGIKLLKELTPEQEAKAVKKHGSLEHPRLLELPDEVTFTNELGIKETVKILETDPLEVIPQYITRSSRRMGVIKSFKQGTETFEALLKEAGDNVEARRAITNAWNDVQRLAHRPSIEIGTAMRFIRPVENITRGALLSLAQLSNVPGEIATVYKAGLKNSAKAFVDSFRKSESAKFDFDRKLGAWSNDVLRDLQTTEDLTGKTGKIARGAMRAYGFEGINRHINKVGARAMQLTIEDYFDLLRKGESSTLQKIMGRGQEAITRTLQRDFFWTAEDIARIKASGLTIKDKARVAQRAPALINVIGESALDRPSWIRHPVMQRFMAYTSFGRAMGNILSDTLKETKYGNFKPLATFLVGQQLAGELEIWLKNFVLNKERTDTGWTDRLINNYLGSMTLGVWGVGYEKLKWARGNPIEGMIPPNIEVPIELAAEMTKAVANGELPDVFRAVAERIPIWRAGVVTAERIIDPESAEARRQERTQRILSRHYNEQYFQALKDKDRDRMKRILEEARERGVTLSEQSVGAKMGEEIKRGARKLDVFETLGAGRKKK